VSAEKLALLRAELGADASAVEYSDMASIGANPARIIPVWREFVTAHGRTGRRLRGVGEPAAAGRTSAELAECHRHEALLNLAFADAKAFHLLCTYDVDSLDPVAIAEAQRTHPFVATRRSATAASARYAGIELAASPFTDPLPDPPGHAQVLEYDAATMNVVRNVIVQRASAANLDEARTSDLVLAVNEIATNSIRHGGGRGTLFIWEEDDRLLCEVRDAGYIREPLVGRIRPAVEQIGGYGVWLANQTCDLVQIRSSPVGSTVRLHMRRG
jgi:anti-sigma regulatory factor (Ser/Thr protein kinase)